MRVEGAVLRVEGAGLRVQGSGCRVQGAGSRVAPSRGSTGARKRSRAPAGVRVVGLGEGLRFERDLEA